MDGTRPPAAALAPPPLHRVVPRARRPERLTSPVLKPPDGAPPAPLVAGPIAVTGGAVVARRVRTDHWESIWALHPPSEALPNLTLPRQQRVVPRVDLEKGKGVRRDLTKRTEPTRTAGLEQLLLFFLKKVRPGLGRGWMALYL